MSKRTKKYWAMTTEELAEANARHTRFQRYALIAGAVALLVIAWNLAF